jgi:ATP-dependent Clp protease protease subunit
MISRLGPILLFAALIGQEVPPVSTRQVEAETALIQARLELAAAQRKLATLPQTDELRRLEAEATLRAARAEAAAVEIDAERSQLQRTAALEAARKSAALAEGDRRRTEIESEVRLNQAQNTLANTQLDAEAALAVARKRAAKLAYTIKVEHPLDPLINGTLHVSDRRIPFNGPVGDDLAKFVCDHIAFYNLQSEKEPIFIVIDASPGGSVMSGYQILRAMQTSKAPVYVVVKQYAASMAAVVTTLAKRSFCYPSTVILHHQPSTTIQGNMTQLHEQLDWSAIWCGRINVEVAKRLGITLDEFVKQMYAATVTGDWKILGDEAVRRHWVTDVVEKIAEDSVDELSAAPRPAPVQIIRANSAGKKQIVLPILQPGDAWMIYDPENIYLAR